MNHRVLEPTPADDPADRARQIDVAVYQFLTKRTEGDAITESEYESRYPHLLPELSVALRKNAARLRMIAEVQHQDRVLGMDDFLRVSQEPPSADPRPSIPGYTVLREISSGGQGSVYEAVQHHTKTILALKVVVPRGRNSIARFEREVLALSAVNHPGIVNVVDRGRTLDRSYFFAMPYVSGLDLDGWLSAQRADGSSQRKIIEQFRDIALALGAAHRRKIVHRDLKPSNIRIDLYGRPKVVDFGLAYLIDETVKESRTRLTLTGNILGSIPWSSPEQIVGVGTSTPASDVYSIGVLLYHALVGRFPYDVYGPLHVVTKNICEVIPSEPRIGPFGRVDRALAAVISKCLAKDRESRYCDGAALAEVLTKYLDGELREPSPRRRILPLAISCACILTAFIMIAFCRQRSQPSYSPSPGPTITNTVGIDMIAVPSGRFTMGSPLSEPGHQDNEQSHIVWITRGFLISRTEVTQGQYRRVMGGLPYTVTTPGDNLPVDNVSWEDAQRFCARLSAFESKQYRLPTEAEWEYSCRAGSTHPYSGLDALPSMGWFSENSNGKLHSPGLKSANHWGLVDTHGNVAEWVLDAYIEHLGREEQRDPVHLVDGQARVVRGGGFRDGGLACRSASRFACPSSKGLPAVGFRVVLEASQLSRGKSNAR
jgi:formylglycine-generating enzyme required for sulfatase activity